MYAVRKIVAMKVCIIRAIHNTAKATILNEQKYNTDRHTVTFNATEFASAIGRLVRHLACQLYDNVLSDAAAPSGSRTARHI